MRTGNDKWKDECSPASSGFRIRVTHINDKELQTLIVAIVLVTRTLVTLVGVALQIVMRKFSFDTFANLDDGELGRALKHGTGDQITHAIGELFVDGLTASLAHDGADHVLRILSSDAAHVVRRDIALFELGVFAGLLVGLTHGNHLVYVDLARLAIES